MTVKKQKKHQKKESSWDSEANDMKEKEVTGDMERTEAGEKRLHWSRDGGWGGLDGMLERMEERESDGTDEPGSDASVEETSSEEPSRKWDICYLPWLCW